jgi:hypothetical protein
VKLPEDIVAEVRRNYSEDDSLRMLAMLVELKKENPKFFSDRLLRCLVVSGGGNMEKFAEAMNLARSDWRELFVAAEYSWGNRIRFLLLPFGICPEISLFKKWFSGQQLILPWKTMPEEKWTIKPQEIKDLSIVFIYPLQTVPNDPDLYFGSLSFLAVKGPKEISISKAVEARVFVSYRVTPEAGEFKFHKFWYLPKDIKKRGKWPAVNQ